MLDEPLNIIGDDQTKLYLEELRLNTRKHLMIATEARKKGFDPEPHIETIPTVDLADRTEAIIGPKGVGKRFRELIEELNGDRFKVMFKIAEEIMSGELGNIVDLQARIDQTIRTLLVIFTEGVVVAPLDGVPRVLIGKNFDGSEYVDVYYASPIRAAGATAGVLPLITADFVRKLAGLDRYKPTDDEIERYVEDILAYEEMYPRQYKMTANEIRTLIKNCPVCINGEATEDKEVGTYRDLPRVHTNKIRGGIALVVAEGLLGKPAQILLWAKELGLDWNFLENFIKVKKDSGKITGLKPNDQYIARIAAGRPIFSYPSAPRGFRVRYGRGRTSGLMAKGFHPATMFLSDEFIACGTQLKIERPGKATESFAVDSIDGPIVRFKNGNVKKIVDVAESQTIYPEVEKILFLGDMLVPYGDFRKSAHPLMPSPYVEEWWGLEVKKALADGKQSTMDLKNILKNPRNVSSDQALQISKELNVPLHPSFIHYYGLLNFNELKKLIEELQKGILIGKKLELKNNPEIKLILESIGLEHTLNAEKEKIIIDEFYIPTLMETFGINSGLTAMEKLDETKTTLENINLISCVPIKDKCGTWIGSRMGRPEQAKPRQMVGNPHVLFPIALFGGNTRNMIKALDFEDKKTLQKSVIEVEMALYYCDQCQSTKESSFCLDCHKRTRTLGYCKKCERTASDNEKEKCLKCGSKLQFHNKRKIDLKKALTQASKNISTPLPDVLKGVKGLFSDRKYPEPIEKGILRAKHNLHMFKDGTLSYESLNATITHFKPREIGLSVARAHELGYVKDWLGNDLANEEQIVEMMVQDIIVNEEGAEFFLHATQFIDDLLLRFYGLETFYNAKTKSDLVGQLVLGLAPHTSAGVVSRIIGFSKARLVFGHPYWVCAKRRNIDGDQDSLLLLMDALLNFSPHFLGSGRGGRMDAPLVFTVALNPKEVDSEVYEMETVTEYPLELYEKSLEFENPKNVKIPIINDRVGKPNQYLGLQFTHSTHTFDEGPKKTMYVQLKSMQEKITRQANLQNKIWAVDGKNALERVLASHFLPDIIGNARAFSRQTFRCGKCNEIYRRIPLAGKCIKCGNPHLILTIAQGSVTKYLELAKMIVKKYELSSYMGQRLDLIENEINSVFKNDKQQQSSLAAFM